IGVLMRSCSFTTRCLAGLLNLILLLATCAPARAQSAAALQGRVMDSTGAVVVDATVTVRNPATSLQQTAQTDSEGNYQLAALPVGTYRIEVRAPGFQTEIVEGVTIEVGRSAA